MSLVTVAIARPEGDTGFCSELQDKNMFSVLGDESKDSVDDLSLSLLQRLRLRKERELLRLQFSAPVPDPVLSFCEFLGKPCEYKHVVKLLVASHHLKPDSTCDCWNVLHKPTRVSTSEVGKNELGRCQMPKKAVKASL